MPNDIIQAQYDELTSVAGRFGGQAEASKQLLAQVRGAMQPLQGGGWQGRGSAAFFAEMNGDVLPAMQRLAAALDQARTVTKQAYDIMKAAEAEASRPFRSNGAAPAALVSGAAFAGGAGAGQGAVTGATPPQPVAAGPESSGPYHIGPPRPPSIKHDNGFLDEFAPREPTMGDRLELMKWRVKLEGAEALRPDLVDGLAAYRHFLDGDGADRTFSYERYVENDPSGQTTLRNLIIDAQRNVEVIGQGRNQFSVTSDAYSAGGSDARFPYPDTENWQKTIGGHNLWTSADVQATGTAPNRTFSMTLTVNVEDRYNFNPGAADIATGIPDSDNGVFEITGLAHQYMNRSQLTRVVTWREGDIINTQITDTAPSRNRRPGDNRRLRNKI